MNFKYWKLLFYMTLMNSIMITISTFSWLNMWMGLEINMLSIIPLMNQSKNMFMTEASLKYFIVQAMASSILLLSIILMSTHFMDNKIMLIMNSSLLIKIGSAPFHFWFPEIMEGQMWAMCFNLLTIQKISPFMLLNYNMNSPYFFSIIIILNMIISALMGLNQISMRKILTFSSINHIGWMITTIMFMKTIWIFYFLIYTFTLICLIYILNNFNIYYLKQMINLNMPINLKMIIMMNFLSMGGLPPFIGFLPKWLSIQLMVMNNFTFLMTMMVILTLLTLFYYTRLIITSLMLMKNTNSLKFKINNSIIFMNLMNILTLPLMFIIFMV
uniref:NADH dehydrogenase subunit 2 n=1 Tax=Anotylus gibbulus TaxID=2992775 RepID=UPI002A7FF903|nr:NADH dehydrogenase subunit 2 [Anotylus gibbulus]UZA61053.1 NADH dehydrogenase subunit 2 [Anotylus gibbulus]